MIFCKYYENIIYLFIIYFLFYIYPKLWSDREAKVMISEIDMQRWIDDAREVGGKKDRKREKWWMWWLAFEHACVSQ